MKLPENPLYFIALMPPEDIRKEVENFKKEIKLKFNVKHALKLPAHLTIKIPFRIPELRETLLVEKLEKFSNELKPINMELDGFGRFDKKVIFIKIREHEQIIEIHKKLQVLIGEITDLKKHEIASKIHPHLTIATRDLSRTQFPKVWTEFEQRDYKAGFKASQIYLLKHNGKTWDIFRKFQLSEG